MMDIAMIILSANVTQNLEYQHSCSNKMYYIRYKNVFECSHTISESYFILEFFLIVKNVTV